MSTAPTQFKSFLGKYYSELLYSSAQEKYINSGLDVLFDQKFHIQTNKTQMTIDPFLQGLVVNISGNEIYVSKELYDHEDVMISNSMETQNQQQHNPRQLYNPEVFSTLAYLVCQNHTTFHIVGKLDKPIYVRCESEFETFYNSVVVFNIEEDVEVEIVEEFESLCVLNVVTNYILNKNSKLKLFSLYQNRLYGTSLCLRNIILRDATEYNHILFGKGSQKVLDETKISTEGRTSVNMLGCIDVGKYDFNTVVGIQTTLDEHKFSLDYKHIVCGNGKSTFTPLLNVADRENFPMVNDSLITDSIPEKLKIIKMTEFLLPITDTAKLDSKFETERFYSNKAKFLQFK